MNEIISLDNVTFGYEKETVLENLDMKIYEGDLIGIMGENGAGKSTLIKLILGQLEPWHGSVMMNGKKVSKYDVQNGIGYVPQRASVKNSGFPATAEEIVMLNLFRDIGFLKRPQKHHYQTVHNALRMVEMEEYANRLIYKMSGGQQQRVFLARALVKNADIYMMDEPFQGVDAKTEKSIVSVLQRLRNLGKTVIVVHHDLQTVKSYFDEVTLLNIKVVASGPVQEVFTENNIKQTYRIVSQKEAEL